MDWILPSATKAAQIITAVIFGWIAVYGIIWLILAIVKIFRKGIVRSAKESLGTGHVFYAPEQMTEASKKNYSRMEILHHGVMVKRKCPRCGWPLYLLNMETWGCANCGFIQTLEESNKNFIEKIKNRKKRFFRGLFLFCVWLFTWVPLAIVLNVPSVARVIPGNWKTVIRIYIISVWLVSFGYLLYTDWKKRQG